MLGSHRVDNSDEGFIGIKEAMSACQQITFQPALTHMLGKHAIHDSAISGQMLIRRQHLCLPRTILCLKGMVQTVGHTLIR